MPTMRRFCSQGARLFSRTVANRATHFERPCLEKSSAIVSYVILGIITLPWYKYQYNYFKVIFAKPTQAFSLGTVRGYRS